MKFTKSRVFGAIVLILAALLIFTGVSGRVADRAGTPLAAAYAQSQEHRQEAERLSAAVAAAHPEEVELLPRRVVLNRRFLEVGLLEEADPEVPEELTAPVELVHVRDGAALREHVYRTWERGLGQG